MTLQETARTHADRQPAPFAHALDPRAEGRACAADAVVADPERQESAAAAEIEADLVGASVAGELVSASWVTR